MGCCGALFVLSLVWATTYTKSITSNSENFRTLRQLDFGECCPCPEPKDEQLIYQAEKPSADDCPCRNRELDSEAASSILTPALQALRPFVRSDVTKPEPEPLLKPEIGLASSVLETLKEVTNEEYQDSLARDAARSVVKALETDLSLMQPNDVPENIINIILNPKATGDDLEVVPEASHLQETRCVHSPLGRISNYETEKPQSSLFLEPRRPLQPLDRNSKSRGNHFDMDNGASNIQNSLHKPSNGYFIKSLNQKFNSNEFLDELQNENSLPRNNYHQKNINSDSNSQKINRFTKVPNLQLSTIVENIKKSIESNPILNHLARKNTNTRIPDKKTPIYNSLTEGEPVSYHTLTSTLNPLILNNIKKPMKLRNLLKLKDVEFIPMQNTNNNIKKNRKKTEEKSLIDDDNLLNASVNEDSKLRDSKVFFESENMDTVPSSSNTKNTNIIFQVTDKKVPSINQSIPSDSLSTSESNLIEKSEFNKDNEFVESINNSMPNINSIKYESNDQDSECSDLKAHIIKEKEKILESNDSCIIKAPVTQVQNESDFNQNDNNTKPLNKSLLPLLRADIIKGFENFKKVNDDMQEKLRQNLQDMLQVVDTDNKIVESENCIPYTEAASESNTNLNSNETVNKEKSITVDDLQKMSDSILHKSNIKQKDLVASENNKQLSEEIMPVDCVESKNDAQKFNIEKSSEESFSKDNMSINNLRNLTNEQNILLDKRQSILNNSLAQNDNLSNDSENLSNENPIVKDTNDIKTEVFDESEIINTALPLSSSNNSNYNNNSTVSHHENGCTVSNSNEMSVQASETITNRAAFFQPELNQEKSDRYFKSKLPLSSALKPYSAKVIGPSSLDRDLLSNNLANKINSIQSGKNNYLQDAIKNDDRRILLPLETNEHQHPSDGLETIADNLKYRTAEPLKKLNHVLGMSKNKKDQIRSNHLFEDVLSNTGDIRKSFSKAHNVFNDNLQKLRMDWNDRIQSLSEHADSFDRTTLSKATNAGRNNAIISKKKTPLVSFNTKHAENKLKEGKPKSFINSFNQENSIIDLQLTPKPLNEKRFSIGKGKSTISTYTTTLRPKLIYSTKRPQKKSMVLNSAPKPTLSQTIKNALESVSANKLKMNIRDSNTLSSDIVSVTSKNQNIISRSFRSESHETNEIENTSFSLEERKNMSPIKQLNDGSGRRNNLVSNNKLPLQLKAEEFSLLSKLLEGIRNSSSKSDAIMKSKDNYVYVKDENLQSPSLKVEQIKMPENTPKENIAYKCKMICTKDKK